MKTRNENLDKNFRKQFGRRFAKARKEAGWLQSDCASVVGTSKSSISMYECGQSFPPPEILNRMVEQTGRSHSWFFTGEDHGSQKTQIGKDEARFLRLYQGCPVERRQDLFMRTFDAYHEICEEKLAQLAEKAEPALK